MNQNKTLLFFPTSPVHIIHFTLIMEKLKDWNFVGVVFSFMKYIPGIKENFARYGINNIEIEETGSLSSRLPDKISLVLIGAAFEPGALELFVWAKLRQIPVIAIEEVAQLSLNDLDMNNYDLPFDRLFLASNREYQLSRQIGYPDAMLKISGLLANDLIHLSSEKIDPEDIKDRIGIPSDKKVLVYTTSPIRHRLAVHNKDDSDFRKKVLYSIKYATANHMWSVVIKLHPNENVKKEKQYIHEIIPDAIVLGREINILDLFVITDALVNRGNSQTALDAALTGCPTIIISHGLHTVFHDFGGAFIAENTDGISAALSDIEKGEIPDTTRLRENLLYLPSEGVATYIAQEIVKLATQNTSLTSEQWEWVVKTFLFHGLLDRAKDICTHLSKRTKLLDVVEQALTYHSDSNFPLAVEAWEKCKSLDKVWYVPYYELAHIYTSLGTANLAIDNAQKAIEFHPPYHRLWHEIPMRIIVSSCYRMRNQINTAWKALDPLIKQGTADIMPELLIEEASLFLKDNNKYRCMTALEKAICLLEQYPIPWLDGEFYQRAGIAYKDCSEFNKAFECFEKAIRLNPKNPWSYFEKGLLLKLGNKPDKALESFDKAILLDPDNPSFYFEKGLVKKLQHDFNGATTDFEKAIALNPGDYHFYFQKSLVYAYSKRYFYALKYLGKAFYVYLINKKS
jgi:tetratricopeptide (TPR) repeat protein